MHSVAHHRPAPAAMPNHRRLTWRRPPTRHPMKHMCQDTTGILPPLNKKTKWTGLLQASRPPTAVPACTLAGATSCQTCTRPKGIQWLGRDGPHESEKPLRIPTWRRASHQFTGEQEKPIFCWRITHRSTPDSVPKFPCPTGDEPCAPPRDPGLAGASPHSSAMPRATWRGKFCLPCFAAKIREVFFVYFSLCPGWPCQRQFPTYFARGISAPAGADCPPTFFQTVSAEIQQKTNTNTKQVL